jgi:trehalose/maltose hydrolase-like predicted phosphorylase
MQLKYVYPNELKQVWSQIKPSLEDMASRSTWIVEDAYSDIKEGRANLYLTINNNYFTGYIITQTLGQTLHIWAAYNTNNDVLKDGLEATKELAKQQGLSEITFISPRRGWDKIAPKLGFKPSQWVYKL